MLATDRPKSRNCKQIPSDDCFRMMTMNCGKYLDEERWKDQHSRRKEKSKSIRQLLTNQALNNDWKKERRDL
jgi:hypothetical protein